MKRKKKDKALEMRNKLYNFYGAYYNMPIEQQDPTGVHRAFSKYMGGAYQRKVANKKLKEDGK